MDDRKRQCIMTVRPSCRWEEDRWQIVQGNFAQTAGGLPWAEASCYVKPELVWQAAVPHGLRLSAVTPDDPPTQYGSHPTEPAMELPSGAIQSGLLYRQAATTDALYSNQKIALGAEHTFFALVTPVGDALEYGAVASFRPNDALGVFAYAMGSHFGGEPKVFVDDWAPSGFEGPGFTPGEPQLVCWKGSLDADGVPQMEMAVLADAAGSAPAWVSTSYGRGLEEYGRDMMDEQFDIDLRDPDVDGLHALAAGFLVVGNWANRGDMQFRGAIHHLEWHVGALADASVQAVAADILSTYTGAEASRPAHGPVAQPRSEVPLAMQARPDAPQSFETGLCVRALHSLFPTVPIFRL
jgi:hypothetical protein